MKEEEKGTIEDEMVGWHHPLNAHMFEQALGVGDGSEAWSAAVHGVAKRHDWATELNREEDLGRGVSCVSSSCRGSVGFLTRYDEDLREPLVQCQVSHLPKKSQG